MNERQKATDILLRFLDGDRVGAPVKLCKSVKHIK